MEKILENIKNFTKKNKRICIVTLLVLVCAGFVFSCKIETPKQRSERIAKENEDADNVLICIDTLSPEELQETDGSLSDKQNEAGDNETNPSVQVTDSLFNTKSPDSQILPEQGNTQMPHTTGSNDDNKNNNNKNDGENHNSNDANNYGDNDANNYGDNDTTDYGDNDTINYGSNHGNDDGNDDGNKSYNAQSQKPSQGTQTKRPEEQNTQITPTKQPVSSRPTQNGNSGGDDLKGEHNNVADKDEDDNGEQNNTDNKDEDKEDGDDEKNISVKFIVTCKKVVDNDELETDAHIPDNGIIFSGNIVVKNNTTVFEALEAVCNYSGIPFVNRGSSNSVYVSSIGNLDEKQCGQFSGWKYKVNGKVPNMSCGTYKLSDQDEVEWYYATHYND